MANQEIFIPIIQKYFEKEPVEAARQLESMSLKDAVKVLQAIPPRLSAQVFPYLPDDFAAAALKGLSPEVFQQIIEKLEPRQGATIFTRLPDESRQSFLEHLPENTKRQIQEFLTYPEDSAGRIMRTDFLSFHSDMKVKDAIQKIRSLAKKSLPASYLYVVDRGNHLAGVINMRDMMLASGQETLEDIMREDVFTIDSFMDREVVAAELSKRRYFGAPVVDSEKHLLGFVRAEELIEDVQEEASEDIQKMFGAGGDERAFSSIAFSLKNRLPWLHVNLASAFLAAAVVALFEGLIAKITILAVFLPVVAGQGGNAGAQSLAIVMRGIVMREVPPHKARRLILKETWIGVLNGLIIGIVTALIAIWWKGNPFFGLVIGLGMLVNLTVAGLAGAGIPIVMKAIGFDPAQCSNIILTTITDVMGFFAFPGFALLFQNLLI